MRKKILSILMLCLALCLTMAVFSACDSDGDGKATTTTTTQPPENPPEPPAQGSVSTQDFGNYTLVFISNGDGTASAGVLGTNPDCTENFTVTFPEASPIGDTVTEIRYIPHIQTKIESHPILPCIMTADDWESKIKVPLQAALDSEAIDEYTYAKVAIMCFEKKSLEETRTEPGKEKLLADYPMTAYTDIYILKPTSSAEQLDWITTILTEHAGFTAETPQTLLQNLVSAVNVDRYATLLLSSVFSAEQIREIVLSNTVTSIGEYAFEAYTSLTSITIPDGVASIGGSAFKDCTSLEGITIPSSVTRIGISAFSNCESLNAVYISDISAWCAIGFEFDTKGDYTSNPLYYAKNLYLNSEPVTDLIIPNGVTSISAAFINCTNLTSVTIPASVTSIGDYAFEGCTRLNAVYISDLAAWYQISFSNYVSNPLYYAKNLYLNGELVTDLVIPDNVTSIGDYAFEGCTSLTRITIGNGVTSISDFAFNGCTSLTSITIPNSVTSIGYAVFSRCSSLTDIYFGGTEEEWNAFTKHMGLSNNVTVRFAK